MPLLRSSEVNLESLPLSPIWPTTTNRGFQAILVSRAIVPIELPSRAYQIHLTNFRLIIEKH